MLVAAIRKIGGNTVVINVEILQPGVQHLIHYSRRHGVQEVWTATPHGLCRITDPYAKPKLLTAIGFVEFVNEEVRKDFEELAQAQLESYPAELIGWHSTRDWWKLKPEERMDRVADLTEDLPIMSQKEVAHRLLNKKEFERLYSENTVTRTSSVVRRELIAV